MINNIRNKDLVFFSKLKHLIKKDNARLSGPPEIATKTFFSEQN